MDTITQERTFSPSLAVAGLTHEGYAEFPSPPAMLDAVRQAQEGFADLLENPFLWKLRIPDKEWPVDKLGEPLEQGLVFKPGTRKKTPTPQEIAEGRFLDDRKWYYHYVEGIKERHEKQEAPTERFDRFFTAMKLITEATLCTAEMVAKELDACNLGPVSGPSFSERMREVREDPSLVITRINRYEEGVGNFHWDRSFLTLHQCSSAKGLVLYGRKGTPVFVDETNPLKACLFPGLKYFIARREAPALTGVHGVRAPAKIRRARKRFSIASFVHLPLTDEEKLWREENQHLFTFDQALLRA